MSAIVYIIPGFRERANSKAYKNIAARFKKLKIKPIMISIQWRYRSMTDYLNQFRQQVDHSNHENYVLGFSFGAMIAAVEAPYLKPKKLFLCSLSPFFKEDLPALSIAGRRSLGIKRLVDFSTYSFKDIAKKITCKTFLFFGAHELPSVIDWAMIAHKEIQNSKLITIQEGNHDISNPTYQREILNTIKK